MSAVGLVSNVAVILGPRPEDPERRLGSGLPSGVEPDFGTAGAEEWILGTGPEDDDAPGGCLAS